MADEQRRSYPARISKDVRLSGAWVQLQRCGIFAAKQSRAGSNVGLKAASHDKRSRRGGLGGAKAARWHAVGVCRCMGGMPDGHAKCCQKYALARQNANGLGACNLDDACGGSGHSARHTAGSNGATVQWVRRAIAQTWTAAWAWGCV
jgi:hypothetical protein